MKTIVWDVDDVLNNLTDEWFKWWKSKRLECRIKFEELTENPPDHILNISKEEYLKSLDEFRLEYGAHLQPIPEVYEWFSARGQEYRHIALSAVPLKCAHISSEWVMRNYGMWIRSFNFVPSKRINEDVIDYDKSKAEYLAQSGTIDLFIDDNINNISAVRDFGVPVLEMPRPWNNGKTTIDELLNSIANMLD